MVLTTFSSFVLILYLVQGGGAQDETSPVPEIKWPEEITQLRPIQFYDCLYNYYFCTDHYGSWPDNKGACYEEYDKCEKAVRRREVVKGTIRDLPVGNSVEEGNTEFILVSGSSSGLNGGQNDTSSFNNEDSSSQSNEDSSGITQENSSNEDGSSSGSENDKVDSNQESNGGNDSEETDINSSSNSIGNPLDSTTEKSENASASKDSTTQKYPGNDSATTSGENIDENGFPSETGTEDSSNATDEINIPFNGGEILTDVSLNENSETSSDVTEELNSSVEEGSTTSTESSTTSTESSTTSTESSTTSTERSTTSTERSTTSTERSTTFIEGNEESSTSPSTTDESNDSSSTLSGENENNTSLTTNESGSTTEVAKEDAAGITTNTSEVLKGPQSCSDISEEDGSSSSGVYTLILDGKKKEVYCEMKDGDGWTILQRRGEFDNEENYFYRNWEEYRDGFGELEGEHWIGLEAMFELTNQEKKVDLRFILEDYEGNRTAVTLVEFRVANEESAYRLFYKGIINHARSKYPLLGRSVPAKGTKFSALDRDNDEWKGNCAVRFSGGWWYSACHNSNINGLNLRGPHKSFGNGINWFHFRGYHYSLKATEMKIKPSMPRDKNNNEPPS